VLAWGARGRRGGTGHPDQTKLSDFSEGASQDHLSEEADLALNTTVKIETGGSPNPAVDTLEKIAKALGVSVDDLFKE